MADDAHPPRQRRGVPRKLVPTVVEDLLLNPEVKWIAILYDDTVGSIDRFHVVPYTVDPAH